MSGSPPAGRAMHYSTDPLRVLVSGGATGVGLACAEAFAARGAELVLTDHDGTGLTRAAERLDARSRFCDSISEASVAIVAADIAEEFPSLDVLINAAGTAYVRTLAMTRMTRALLPVLRRGGGARFVINIAPAGGFRAADEMFPYASSIEAFDRLSEALEEQTRGTSISVLRVSPTIVRGPSRSAAVVNRLYELEHVDELDTAERIVDLVSAGRPEWRHRSPPVIRRA